MTTDTCWKDTLFYRAFNTDSENMNLKSEEKEELSNDKIDYSKNYDE